jgi:hypothetical protein
MQVLEENIIGGYSPLRRKTDLKAESNSRLLEPSCCDWFAASKHILAYLAMPSNHWLVK